MKVKSSRGIVIKLICCMALIVLASAVAVSQTPKSGALLTITNGSSVNLKIYDSQIHTGTVRTNSCDQIPTDAYVLQGGAPTGCDPGDAFETNSGAGVTGTATLGNFTITTSYICASSTGCGGTDQVKCNDSGNVCIGGANPSVDTGFLTVKNNGADFTGTITLAGKSGTDVGFCSPGNTAITDSFTGTLAAGLSRTFALAQDSSNCGGFNQAQILSLTANQTSIASFGKDDYEITPQTSAAGDTLSVLPVPVPAGPLGSVTFTAFPSGQFGFGTTPTATSPLRFSATNFSSVTSITQASLSGSNTTYTYTLTSGAALRTGEAITITGMTDAGNNGTFTITGLGTGMFTVSNASGVTTTTAQSGTGTVNIACVPYADFTANGNPVCVELQLTPSEGDGGNYFYTATNNFNIDGFSLPNGIGGPAFLGRHAVPCPDSGFDINILLSYTAPTVTFGDPLKGGGSGTGSCWVVAFDPNVQAVTTGSTVFTFSGLTSPVLPPPKFTKVNSGSAVPLTWQQFTSSNSPVTNLSLCTTVGNTGATCAGGASAPWVSIGTIQIDCPNELPLAGALEVSAAGGSTLQNFLNGTYRFSLKTTKKQAGTCEAVVFQFDTGVFFITADLKIK